LIYRVLFDNQNEEVLTEEFHPAYPNTPQTYLLFHNIVMPVQAVEDFGEEFRRVPPFKKEISDEERVFSRVDYDFLTLLNSWF